MTAKELLLDRVRLLTEKEAEELLRQLEDSAETAALDPALLEDLAGIFSRVPEDVLSQLPGSAAHDHAIYGIPTRQ